MHQYVSVFQSLGDELKSLLEEGSHIETGHILSRDDHLSDTVFGILRFASDGLRESTQDKVDLFLYQCLHVVS